MRSTLWLAPLALLAAAPAAAQTAMKLWEKASDYVVAAQSGGASTNPVVRAALLEKAVATALQAEHTPGGANPEFIAQRRYMQNELGEAYIAGKRWDLAAAAFRAVKSDFTAPPMTRTDAINYAHAVEGGFTAALRARDEAGMSRAVAEIDRLLRGRPRTDPYITYMSSSVPRLLDDPDFNVTGSVQTRATLAGPAADSNHALSITRTLAAAFPGDAARQNRLLGWLFRNGTLRNDVPTLNEAYALGEKLDRDRRLERDMTIVRDALRERCGQQRTGGQCDPVPTEH